MIYSARPGTVRGGDEIGEVLRSAWTRLSRKQLLFVYPFVLGILNTLAFLAVYAALNDYIAWSEFAQASFARWTYLQEHADQLLAPGPVLAVALLMGLAACVLAAAVRAPYFRAVVGLGYPVSPRSWIEIGRLSLFYLISYTILIVVPYSLPAESTLFAAAGGVALVVAVVFIFADYAVVFGEHGPISAIRESARLVRRGWIPVIILFAAASLVWQGIFALYDNYYSGAQGVFVLFPLSQLLVEALVTTVLDVLLIYLYDHLRRS